MKVGGTMLSASAHCLALQLNELLRCCIHPYALLLYLALASTTFVWTASLQIRLAIVWGLAKPAFKPSHIQARWEPSRGH